MNLFIEYSIKKSDKTVHYLIDLHKIELLEDHENGNSNTTKVILCKKG